MRDAARTPWYVHCQQKTLSGERFDPYHAYTPFCATMKNHSEIRNIEVRAIFTFPALTHNREDR